MTMRELMTHTGGLGYVLSPNNPVDKMIIDARVLNPAAPLQTMIDSLVDDAAAGAAGDPLVLQHRRRRAGLPGREILGTDLRRLPADAHLRSARHERHRLLRAEGEALPSRADPYWRGSDPGVRFAARRSDASCRSAPQAAAGCFRQRRTTRASATCCCRAASLNGVRLLAPRTVEMMRTNHVNPDAAEDDAARHRLGDGLPGGHGRGGGGRFGADRHLQLVGDRRTWFWIDPVDDLAFVGMVQHQDTRVTRPIHGAVAKSGVSGGRGLSAAVSEARMR